jgi:hypothetical protein
MQIRDIKGIIDEVKVAAEGKKIKSFMFLGNKTTNHFELLDKRY